MSQPRVDNHDIEQRALAKWNKSPETRAEFGTLAAFTAYLKAQAAGLVGVYRGAVER